MREDGVLDRPRVGDLDELACDGVEQPHPLTVTNL